MARSQSFFALIVGFVLLGLSALAVDAGEPFEITRYTIDGGGVMRSTGDVYELSGTLGQPDAGVLLGGDFQLLGGFWFEVPPTDCNEDGGVNLLDFQSFKSCLTGPSAGVAPGCECFDVDQSGTIDMADFATVQSEFTGA